MTTENNDIIGSDDEVTKHIGAVKSIVKTDTSFFIQYETGEQAKLSILNNHVFRFYMSPSGTFLDYPEPNDPSHQSKINSKPVWEYDRKPFDDSTLENNETSYLVHTDKIQINIDKKKGTISVLDKRTITQVIKEVTSLSYNEKETTQVLHQNEDEYYFGGGMQNGRFSHKGECIHIVNTNKWVDGGVTSPCPFYWSTKGYGVLRNTWKAGFYDFESNASIITTTHLSEDFDAFYFININPKGILMDYFELTGYPLFMPEYAFYEAHLNAFNRDYWVKVDPDTPKAILFEDGFYYKSYKPDEMGDKKGILESLNGEKHNYQFSARAMIDRYNKHDIPLGWFVPNDGYGSGYGQTDSLDGDIQNLKEFAEYARSNGVEVALWTESNLEPKDPLHPKKGDRDLKKEVSEAGVVALKADVAWIGEGYSFGLSAIERAANIFNDVTKGKVRPMVIMVDGWAGTQRCSGIWSGDQTGGEWEYIRFHIPTYIGSGLSGEPIVGSDMDGIYGGKERTVNVRDFQWKAFTPLQLNMDGWGRLQKTPFTFDKEATNINRAYLKLKSMLMPYNYSIGYESVKGLPMVRAMFLEFPNDTPAFTKDTQYQFMWGPNLLIAPVYNEKEDENSNSIRDGVYLPDEKQVWIDFFTGEKFKGGRTLNDLSVPLWKIPVFVKDGAIIPVVNANNNPDKIMRDCRIITLYPNGKSVFDCYEDDGISCEYKENIFAKTKIEVIAPDTNTKGDLLITINETKGIYRNMVNERKTVFQIKASKQFKDIKVAINDSNIKIAKVDSKQEFDALDNVYYFDDNFAFNKYLNDFVDDANINQSFILIKLQSVDVNKSSIHVKIKGFENISPIFGSNLKIDDNLEIPSNLSIDNLKTTADTIVLQWEKVRDIDFYEIERDGVLFTHIKQTKNCFKFENFKSSTNHKFKIRSLKGHLVSQWSDFVIGYTKE